MDLKKIPRVLYWCKLSIYLFRLYIKKDAEKSVTFKIFYLPSHTDIHSAHAELKHPLFVAYKSIVSYLKVPLWYAPLM